MSDDNKDFMLPQISKEEMKEICEGFQLVSELYKNDKSPTEITLALCHWDINKDKKPS